MQAYSGLSSSMLRKVRKRKSCPLEYEQAEKKQKVLNRQEIEQSFLKDENTIECPDKKAFKIKFGKNKMKKRKRYLKASLRDLYVSYCKSVTKPVSYSKFCSCKPFYVVEKDLKERETCLCEKCENMQLMLTALHRAQAIEVHSTLALARSVSCLERTDECYQRDCTNCKAKEIPFKVCDEKKSVKYFKWVRVVEKKKDNRTEEVKEVKRTIKKQFENTVELKQILQENFKSFMSHAFRDTHQTVILKEKREHLGNEEIYIWQDFSENYNCKYHREIQSQYYGASREQVSLHTGVVYKNEERKAFCTMSECPRHDPPAILAHLIPILKKFLTPEIQIVHFQSDSPTTRYRNKHMFYLVTQYLSEIYPQVKKFFYNFTEAGHGKGAPDGVGAAIKTAADTAVKNGADVHDFESLVAVLKKGCPNIYQASIMEKDIVTIGKKLPSSLPAFKGTMSVHQFIWNRESPKAMQFKSVSCYECFSTEECSHFKLENSPWVLERSDCHNIQTPPRAPPSLHVGNWVVVQYGHHWYPGFVEKVLSKKAVIDFMVKHEKKDDVFLWPPEPDKQSVSKTNILYRLNDPPKFIDRLYTMMSRKS